MSFEKLPLPFLLTWGGEGVIHVGRHPVSGRKDETLHKTIPHELTTNHYFPGIQPYHPINPSPHIFFLRIFMFIYDSSY
jgi:hypothetical protein